MFIKVIARIVLQKSIKIKNSNDVNIEIEAVQ